MRSTVHLGPTALIMRLPTCTTSNIEVLSWHTLSQIMGRNSRSVQGQGNGRGHGGTYICDRKLIPRIKEVSCKSLPLLV